MAGVSTSISFTCPNCAKVLRTSTRPPPGRRVKCPACGEAFLPELADEEAATAIQEAPISKSPTARRDPDDSGEISRSKKPRTAEDEDEPSPRRKSRRDEEDDRPIKKKEKKKSGSRMMLIVGLVAFLGGGGLLSCIACGVGAFVWPGFLLSKNTELLAFVSPDANVVAGGRPKEMKAKFAAMENMLARAGAPGGQAKQFPEMEDLIANSESMIFSANTKDFSRSALLVIKSNSADVDKLKRSNSLGPAKTVAGQANIHKLNKAGNNFGAPGHIAFPGNHVVVFSDLAEDQLAAALNRAKSGAPKSPAIELSQTVNSSPMWVAFTFDAESRRSVKQMFDQAGAKSQPMQKAAAAVENAKGITMAMDVTNGNDLKITASMACKNGSDAAIMKAGLEDGWNMVRALLNFMPDIPGQAEGQKLLIRDVGSMAFKTQNDAATASVTFTAQTMQELAKIGQNVPFNPNFGFDFGKKDFPKGGGGAQKVHQFTVVNIAGGQKQERTFQFKQGDRIRISMVSNTTHPKTDVDLYVYQGNVGFNVITADTTIGPHGNVDFNAPVTGIYRVAVENLGVGDVRSSAVTINEN